MVFMVPCENMGMEINTDISCGRPMHPDMAILSCAALDDTMALGGSTGLSDQDGPSSRWSPDSNMALGHNQITHTVP